MTGTITITAYEQQDDGSEIIVKHTCKGTVGMAYKTCQRLFGRCSGSYYDSPSLYWTFMREGRRTDVTITGNHVTKKFGYRTQKE